MIWDRIVPLQISKSLCGFHAIVVLRLSVNKNSFLSCRVVSSITLQLYRCYLNLMMVLQTYFWSIVVTGLPPLPPLLQQVNVDFYLNFFLESTFRYRLLLNCSEKSLLIYFSFDYKCLETVLLSFIIMHVVKMFEKICSKTIQTQNFKNDPNLHKIIDKAMFQRILQ